MALKDLTEMPKVKWKADSEKLYSLFMLNPDVPSRSEASEVRHINKKFSVKKLVRFIYANLIQPNLKCTSLFFR